MGFKAITKNTPAEEPPHILSEDDAAIYRGILGQDGVLNIGSKLKPTVISNNKVRVGDGVINVDGHIGRNAYADYEDLTIENGSAGKKRHDLIVASFSTTGSGGLDTYILKVIKGVTGDTGADPAVTKQDIYAGGKLREYPLYRVKLDGLSIVAVEQMFKVIPTVPELETKYNELNSTLKVKHQQAETIYFIANIEFRKSGHLVNAYVNTELRHSLPADTDIFIATIPEEYRPVDYDYNAPLIITARHVGIITFFSNGDIMARPTEFLDPGWLNFNITYIV